MQEEPMSSPYANRDRFVNRAYENAGDFGGGRCSDKFVISRTPRRPHTHMAPSSSQTYRWPLLSKLTTSWWRRPKTIKSIKRYPGDIGPCHQLWSGCTKYRHSTWETAKTKDQAATCPQESAQSRPRSKKHHQSNSPSATYAVPSNNEAAIWAASHKGTPVREQLRHPALARPRRPA